MFSIDLMLCMRGRERNVPPFGQIRASVFDAAGAMRFAFETFLMNCWLVPSAGVHYLKMSYGFMLN